jgi:hypothetical protein
MNETFISYNHQDVQFATKLELALRAKGHDPWIDYEDIPAAVKWEPEMLLGAQRCLNFVFILSPDSLRSEPCMKELDCAVRHNKRLIPLLHRACHGLTVPRPLAELNWIFFHDFGQGVEKLHQVLTLPPEQMGALVDRTQAYLKIHKYDGSITPPFPLYQSRYIVGRAPVVPSEKAGAIIVRDPNRYISKIHLELKVLGGKWYAFSLGKNKIDFSPYSPDGLLRDQTQIILGSGVVISYQEVRPEEPEDPDPRDTFY